MDFRNRGVEPQTNQSQSANQTVNSAQPASGSSSHGRLHLNDGRNKWLERGAVVILIALALLIASIAMLAYTGGVNQSKVIKKDGYQAVFLNNGQVYFGKINTLNSKFIDLQNIYYLQTSSTGTDSEAASKATDVKLIKLGCELHAPFDQMVINNDQVIFWENLKESGQVAKAIAKDKTDNPKGLVCSDNSQSSTDQAPATNAPASGASTPTSAPTTTKKP